jgi:hypothetical protein
MKVSSIERWFLKSSCWLSRRAMQQLVFSIGEHLARNLATLNPHSWSTHFIIFLGDSLITLGEWCYHRQNLNGAWREIISKVCDIAAFLWRSASRFGWHRRNFFAGGGDRLSNFFLVRADSTYRDLSKNDFFEILPIFSARAKILDYFFDKSLILGNRLEPIERST